MPDKTPLQQLIAEIENKITAGEELGYDFNHDGMIQLKLIKEKVTELLPAERDAIVEAVKFGLSEDWFTDKTAEQYYETRYGSSLK